MKLQLRDEAVDKAGQDELVALVRKHAKVSFKDSSGKRRFANEGKDLEARAVLLQVALLWLDNPSALMKVNYNSSVVAEGQKDRLIAPKTSMADFHLLSDDDKLALSAASREVLPAAEVSVEGILHDIMQVNNANGVKGLSAGLKEIAKRRRVDLPGVKSALAELKKDNAAAAAAANLGNDGLAQAELVLKSMDAKLAEHQSWIDAWRQSYNNLDTSVTLAGSKLVRCQADFARAQPKAASKPVATLPEAPAGEGLLRGVKLHTLPSAPPPKEEKKEDVKEDAAPAKK